MEKTGLHDDIQSAVRLIERGRRKHFTKGTEAEGLQEFTDGNELLHKSYADAVASGNLDLILSAEYYFLNSEIAEGDSDETLARASSEAGLEVIDDALSALKAVADSAMYRGVDMAYPRHDKKKWRYKDLPKDAFHVFCESHIARLNNGLKRFGVSRIDRELIRLRTDTLAAVEDIYCELQKKALAADNK